MTNIKSQQAILTPSSVGVEGLKMVKNASIFNENGVYFIRHYQTIIFAYDTKSNRIEVNWNCSMTSDRQIRSALQFFGINKDDVINVHQGEKWNFSGDLVN